MVNASFRPQPRKMTMNHIMERDTHYAVRRAAPSARPDTPSSLASYRSSAVAPCRTHASQRTGIVPWIRMVGFNPGSGHVSEDTLRGTSRWSDGGAAGGRGVGLEQPQRAGARHRRGAALGGQLAKQTMDVPLDCADFDRERLGDRAVGAAVGDHAQHLQLTLREWLHQRLSDEG